MIDARSIAFRHTARSPWLFADLSFSLKKGQTLVLLGRNGRGKTTLLKCIAGLLKPSMGEIRCNGVIGYVPQSFTPAFSWSAFDVVLMGRARHVGLFSNPTAADRDRAHAAFRELGIAWLTRRPVATLSGGERQLMLIARALASDADLLLLDEPAAALDFRNQAMMLSTLRRLAKDRGLTIVMTTHEPTHALEIADRAVLLHDIGRAQEGTIEDVCTEANLSDLYGIQMKRLTAGGVSSHIVAEYSSVGRLSR